MTLDKAEIMRRYERAKRIIEPVNMLSDFRSTMNESGEVVAISRMYAILEHAVLAATIEAVAEAVAAAEAKLTQREDLVANREQALRDIAERIAGPR